MDQWTRRQTLKEFVSQWEAILTLRDSQSSQSHSLDRARSSGKNGKDNARLNEVDDGNQDDPFDCRSMQVPPTHVLADRVADEFVERWIALDQRKITVIATESPLPDTDVMDEGECDEDNEVDSLHHQDSNPSKRQRRQLAPIATALPRWYEKHVRLPEHFDYTSQLLAQNPPSLNDSADYERVVSLVDPTITTSYHAELWHLFRQIPSADQLEILATTTTTEEGDGFVPLSATRALQVEMETARQHTNMLDGHALSRLRMSDRHDALPMTPSLGWTGSVRFEFLRQQLRRTSTPESNRMVLEFLGSQTLLHVHQAIVELSHDELGQWMQQRTDPPTTAAIPVRDQATTAESNGQSSKDGATNGHQSESFLPFSSGFFFIEDTFYKTGPVDYTAPILQWLSSGNSDRERKRRCLHLGLATDPNGSLVLPTVKDMSQIRLDEISCRLGIRYVHVHNGDIEYAMFLTDRRLISSAATSTVQFPILHDLCSPSHTVPECEVCQTRTAAVATSTQCVVTIGHRALCEACCRQLDLPAKAPDHIMPYNVWRGQADLSAGAAGEVSW
jgi:snRNA-activating protein complex (SNAPc), subunit 3